ncbi:DUF962 domain-containing protein [Pseudoalteromonas denitrificans]|uniref:Uncharacterized membrane protein YGL010W n=1 Tax=Pseudoalteromonas denitrificans DSM 6059 TaxID=1123010 RepID=A0A1I1G6C0_9GAMM|nr:Mpo1-like protein [Pseudoalteromonas denitrificans]SFC04883.1 Uncharacterized membrane protein YGL010W [Pseudoalteromonas denitrificans DSM 6059]
MKTLTQWFDLYGQSHQNKTNIIIHKIAVPIIYLSVIGFIYSIPGLIGDVILSLSIAVAMMFYFKLNKRLGLYMCIYTLLSFLIIKNTMPYTLEVSITMFIIAWVFQFVGHKIEGKKPSFFDDLSFLLIGPAWVFKDLFKLK